MSDLLYARVIFTPEEYAALTPDELVMLDDDLRNDLERQREFGYTFDPVAIEDDTDVMDKYVVVSKRVVAEPYRIPTPLLEAPEHIVTEHRVVGRDPRPAWVDDQYQ